MALRSAFRLVLLLTLSLHGISTASAAASRPNIVLILADDMGYSDLGCYGSEIPTPNLDALAAGGLRFTQFYNSARCSPTRAALLTGLHPHQAGMGRLAAGKSDSPGYLGYLNDRSLTIAEALRPVGYKNYLAGKWHLGQRDPSKRPLAHGFDRFYGILAGAGSYFRPDGLGSLTLDHDPLPAPTDPTYYTTDAFTDFALTTIREHRSDAPFFLYLAYTAPHWPLHAREADIELFVGRYRAGWDKLRAERHAKQLALGVLPADTPLSERDVQARAWDTLSEDEKTRLDYRMAVYAAQVHRMDWNIGRVVDELRTQGKLDHTLILFLSDNGGCAEPYADVGGQAQERINDPAVPTNVSYGTGWANASNTPFRKFKSGLYEGGIATPLIVHWPAGLKAKAGSFDPTPGYITDVMPTLLELTGATYPAEFKGRTTTALEGTSLASALRGTPSSAPRTFFWEQYGVKAVRQGDLKAVFTPAHLHDKTGTAEWELYNVARDRTESRNLAAARPDDLKKLVALWDAWAARAQVFPLPSPARVAAPTGGKKKKSE